MFKKMHYIECAMKVLIQIQRIHLVKDVTLVNTDDAISQHVCQLRHVRFSVRSHDSTNDSYARADAYLINSHDISQLAELLDSVQKDLHYNPRAKFTVIIQNFDEPVSRIADLLLINNVFNVNIILEAEGVWKVYSYAPELDSCNRPVSLEVVSQCSSYDGRISMYSIKNYRNFEGCQIKMVSHNFWPFVTFNRSKAGLDQRMYDLLFQIKGINTSFIQYEKERFGRILPNFTFTGMLALLQRKEVDGATGGFYLEANRNHLLAHTYPVIFDNARVMVPRVPMLKVWPGVIRMLGPVTLAIIALFFITFCIIAIKLSLFSGNKKDFVREILIVFGYFSSNIFYKEVRSSSTHRFIVMNMLLFVFWITAMIQAFVLISTINPIRNYQIKDVDEIYAKLQPITVEVLSDFTIGKREALICDNIRACVSAVMQNKSTYTVVSETAYEGQRLDGELFADSDKLLYKTNIVTGVMPITTYFRHGCPVLDVMSEFVGRLYSSGVMIGQWRALFNSAQISYGFQHNPRVWAPQKIAKMQSVFYLFLVGLVLSFIVFVFELIVKKCIMSK